MNRPSYGVTTAAVRPRNSGCAAASSSRRCRTESISSWAACGRPIAVPTVRACLVPRRVVVGVVAALRHDGHAHGRELLVLLLGHRGVLTDDQVRGERGDPLDLDAVRLGQHGRRLGVAQVLARPRVDAAELLVAEPVGDADGHDPQREQRVLLGEPDADDPLGSTLDGRLAVLVREGDREGALLRSRAPPAPHRALGGPGGTAPTAAGGEGGRHGQHGQTGEESTAAGVHGSPCRCPEADRRVRLA